MTEYLYHTDSYLREFDAVVTNVDEGSRAIVLDRTAFYPGGGGQLCDLGTLTAGGIIWQVEKVRKGPNGIEHILSGDEPLPIQGVIVAGYWTGSAGTA